MQEVRCNTSVPAVISQALRGGDSENVRQGETDKERLRDKGRGEQMAGSDVERNRLKVGVRKNLKLKHHLTSHLNDQFQSYLKALCCISLTKNP